MSLALLSPSAAAAAAAARAVPLRACAQPNREPARRQPSAMQPSPRAAAAARTATASLLRAATLASPRGLAAAAAAAAAAAGGGRLAERGDMVTVHYTLYEEVLDDSAPASASSASSSSPPAEGGGAGAGGGGEASPPPPPAPATAVVVEDPAKKKKYRVLDSSREGDGRGEPLTFEVGAGDVFGNELFQAFDEVVRGRAAGESVRLSCPSPPAWDPELLFRVPGDHPEVERMRGRYKNVGGLAEGLVVELSNGKRAVVVAVSEEEVTLDANEMLAGGGGGERVFELELVRVEEGKKKEEGEG